MARGVSRSIEQRIEELDVKINKKSQEIADLKAQRKELEVQKQSDLLSRVHNLAAEKGISVDELLDAVLQK